RRIVPGDVEEVATASESSPQGDGIAQISRNPFNRETVKILEVGIRSHQYTDMNTGLHEGPRYCRSDGPGGTCQESNHRLRVLTSDKRLMARTTQSSASFLVSSTP